MGSLPVRGRVGDLLTLLVGQGLAAAAAAAEAVLDEHRLRHGAIVDGQLCPCGDVHAGYHLNAALARIAVEGNIVVRRARIVEPGGN